MFLDDADDRVWNRKSLMLGDAFSVLGALDTEARGNWARVVEAKSLDPETTGGEKHVALKIMRGRHLNSESVFQMFAHEARVLQHFGLEASGTQLLATGFVKGNPALDGLAPAEMLSHVDDFISQLHTRRNDGWRPFLVLQLAPFRRTLLYLLRQLHSTNVIIPLWDAINITRHGLLLLEQCHQEQLYYIDHKPEHVIWHDGQVRLIDWNVGEWFQGSLKNSQPLSRVQTDIMNFISYVAFPLFTGVQLDGNPVHALIRATPHPPPPTDLFDGDDLCFYEAGDRLDSKLKSILSRPFWSAGKRYQSATAIADELDEYLDQWEVVGVYGRLLEVLKDIEEAQQSLKNAQRRMKRLHPFLEDPKTAQLPISSEVRRVGRHLQAFVDKHIIPTKEDGS